MQRKQYKTWHQTAPKAENFAQRTAQLAAIATLIDRLRPRPALDENNDSNSGTAERRAERCGLS